MFLLGQALFTGALHRTAPQRRRLGSSQRSTASGAVAFNIGNIQYSVANVAVTRLVTDVQHVNMLTLRVSLCRDSTSILKSMAAL
jgi:hypothetical protein